MKPSVIDSHAHLSGPEAYPDAEGMILRAKAAGVSAIINICTDIDSLNKGLLLAQLHPGFVYNTGSTTPHDVDLEGEEAFPIFAQKAIEGSLIAIGETGLDYFHGHSQKDTQKAFLRRYLRLALECALPVVIHCREAFADFFEILDQEYKVGSSHGPGVLHCFTGTRREAEQVLERGWYLSLSGIITFKKSESLREVAKIVPLSQLIIETDMPYLAPQSKRGKKNESAFLIETASVLADLKQISLEELAAATTKNTKSLFLANLA